MFRIYTIVLCIVLAIGSLVMLSNTHPLSMVASACYLLFSFLVLFNNLVNQKKNLGGLKSKLFLVLELVLAAVMLFFDQTYYTGFYFLIIIGIAILTYDFLFTILYFTAAVLIQTLIYMALFQFSVPALLDEYRAYLIPRFVLILAFISARTAVKTSQKNRQLVDQLRDKTDQLETHVKEQVEAADLRAKSALMHELHDRLGHTLVTASIGMQAAHVLIDQDPQAAKARLEIATQQIQTAMLSLRNVIYGRPDPTDIDSGMLKILGFIQETEKQAGVPIHHNLKDQDKLNFPAQVHTFLYRALMEGVTNGIKHGGASEFHFSLERGRDKILFRLKDNGKGFQQVQYGYGLRKMLEEADKLNATYQIIGQGGCLLEFEIPLNSLENGEINVQDQNHGRG